MAVGVGGTGVMGIASELSTALGVWTTPAVWVPFTAESLKYTEARYYSPAIRNQTIDNAVKQGYYNIAGDVTFEVDTRFLPYWLRAARLTETKTGAGPYVYTYKPNSGGAGAAGAISRGLSITLGRNGQYFGYAGCHVVGYNFAIGNDGILMMTAHIIGMSESVQVPGSPSYVAPRIIGAGQHTLNIALGSASSVPTWVANTNFASWAMDVNDNGAAQNRIGTTPARSAAYVAFGKTDVMVDTVQDFLDRTQYNAFVATTLEAVQVISAGALGAADTFTASVYNSPFDDYEVYDTAIGDIVTANAKYHVVSSGGSNNPFDIIVNTDANVAMPL